MNSRVLYATDEDLAIRAPSDFALLCPKDQCVATADDGYFAINDPWTIRSITVNFASRAVEVGQIVQLLAPSSHFKPPGEHFAIAELGDNWVRLRRKGMKKNEGQPPLSGGSLSGIEFMIASMNPQIESASYELNRIYGIDDLVAGRRRSDLYDPREVRDAVVLRVLERQYRALSSAGVGSRDTFGSKADAMKQELDELLARVVVHWSGIPCLMGTSTSRFETRISR
jgi:hypothetical protein